MHDVSAPASDITYEDLAQLEQEFDDAELQTLREQHKIYAPLYKKRQEVVAKIPNFWALVLEQAPTEFENYVTPSDSAVFAESLKSIEVERFEINEAGGSPRSVAIRFRFDPNNEYFDNELLEKKFWHRRALDGWSGIVSEPVKINWKKGKDLTMGLTDAAVDLFAARKKLDAAAAQNGNGNGSSSNGHAKAKASKLTSLPEYKTLINKIENNTEASLSFFTWFGFISSHGYVTAEESAEANKKEAERRDKRAKGEKIVEDDDDDDDDDFFDESEICPNGEDVAEIIVNELWPQAIKYFTAAQEADDDDLSELSDAELDEDDDEDEPIDIRSLVRGKGKKEQNGNGAASGNSASPPSKKRRT